MPTQSMTSDEAYEVALAAVRRLAQERGTDVTFPFDAIWTYATEDVPSTLRSGQANRLKRARYIEPTGGTTRASSQARASSVTTEYRLGRELRQGDRMAEQPDLEMLSVSTGLVMMEQTMAIRGFIITTAQLANFYLALQTSPLVILAGTSGTGKSWLPRLFSEMIGAGNLFRLISVQPQWADNADLFGYTSSLAPDTFVEGKFTTAMRTARDNTDKPAIVLLDEMNLAAVEHYFSDFLSVIETRRKEEERTVTDPLPLDLPSRLENDNYESLRSLSLPSNVRVVGTANMDETTRSFSPKVLDRAFTIEFDDVDLTAFVYLDAQNQGDQTLFTSIAQRLVDPANPVSISEVYRNSRSLFDRIAGLLEEIKDILKPAGISFGYRTRDAICLYLWHWSHDQLSEVLPLNAAFDMCVLQKVLPKISGTGEALRQSLEQLRDWLDQTDTASEEAAADNTQATPIAADEVAGSEPAKPCPKSAEKVRRMLQQLSDEGATTFWST